MALRQKNASSMAPTVATVVGAGIQIRGRVEGDEDLRVVGRIEGSIRLSETLYVDQEGVVLAEVHARDVVVSGVVIGNVSAVDSVTLNPGAKLIGDISSPRLIVADGAAFRGNIKMTGEAPRPRERARATSAGRSRPAAQAAVRPVARSVAAATARPSSATALADDEVTVVVKHAALRSEDLERRKAPPRVASVPLTDVASQIGDARDKKRPRARVPARGKRKAVRR